MLKRNGIVIDPNKSKEFCEFLRTHGKTKDFWEDNAKKAHTSVNKDDLDKLFGGNSHEQIK